MELWEIMVPTVRNNGRPIRLKHHRVWDSFVRQVAGGLTIYQPAKGEWLSPEVELFAERMIPVRIACDEVAINKIADFTAKHYEQLAVFFLPSFRLGFHKELRLLTHCKAMLVSNLTKEPNMVGNEDLQLLNDVNEGYYLFIGSWLRDAVGALLEERHELKESIKNLKERNAEFQERIDTVREQRDDYFGQLDRAEVDVRNTVAVIRALEQEKLALQAELGKSQNLLRNRDNELQSSSFMLNNMKTVAETFANSLTRIAAEIDGVVKTSHELAEGFLCNDTKSTPSS